DGTSESLPQRVELGLEHSAIGELKEANSFCRCSGDHRSERRFDPGDDNALGCATPPWWTTKQPGEGSAEAAIGFVVVVERHVVEIAPLANLLERISQSAAPAIFVEGESIVRQEMPPGARRIHAHSGEI